MKRVGIVAAACVFLMLSIAVIAESFAAGPLLKKVRFEKISSDEERVYLYLNGKHFPETFGMEGKELRLVCDFPGMKVAKGVKRTVRPTGDLIKKIRIGIHRVPSCKIRIVLDLYAGRCYDIGQHFFEKENVCAIVVKAGDIP